MLFGIEKMIQYWSKLSEVILLHCITFNIPVISGPVIGKKMHFQRKELSVLPVGLFLIIFGTE